MPSGHKCKLYANSATYASPTWGEIPEARDVDISLTAEKIDDSDRGSDFKKYTEGMFDFGVTFKMTYRNGNTNCDLIRDALLNGTVVEFAVMDGAIDVAGNEGFRCPCKVFSNNKSEPLADGQTIDVELAPAYFDESGVKDPEWYTVPA